MPEIVKQAWVVIPAYQEAKVLRQVVSGVRQLAPRVVVVDDGVLVALAPGPWGWDTPEYAVAEQRARDHLGSEVFFSKAEPDRPTVAPDWGR